mmetsp:Transcript_54816/g.119911  ORF Transcript_54816/g.119911 Transcript_54816/m.119911 type:complete len:80 (-) Transcript_54816:618-857(-)
MCLAKDPLTLRSVGEGLLDLSEGRSGRASLEWVDAGLVLDEDGGVLSRSCVSQKAASVCTESASSRAGEAVVVQMSPSG